MARFRRSVWRRPRFKRRRYLRRRLRGKRLRSRMTKGLNYTVQPFACHIINQDVQMPGHLKYSFVYRVTPLGYGSNYSSVWMGRIAECDPRFVKLCALYDWFQIRNMYVEVVLNNKCGMEVQAGYSTISENPAQEVFRAVLLARCVRSCQYNTRVSSFDEIKVDPGTVASKCLNAQSFPRLVYALRPRTKEERQQWIPTKLDGYNVDYWQYNQTYFSPAVDFVLSCPHWIDWKGDMTSANVFSVNIRVRYTIAFRNSSITYTASGRGEEVVDLVGESKQIMDAANLLKKSPNRSLDPSNPPGPDGLAMDEAEGEVADEVAEVADGPAARYSDVDPVSEGQKATRLAGAIAGTVLAAQALRRLRH